MRRRRRTSAAREGLYADEMRLVLADNDEGALDLIALDLRLEGHDIVGLGRDGDEAVALCERQQPDVLVVDYRMPPGINGVEVARRVLGGGAAARVVVYSSYADEAVIRQARELGATWLAKGRLAELRDVVRGEVNHGRARGLES
jgi:CheY-like chemotaxis protein